MLNKASENGAIALLLDIFSVEISEGALTRRMMREEARQHHVLFAASAALVPPVLTSVDGRRYETHKYT
jgi:hypothetical protein